MEKNACNKEGNTLFSRSAELLQGKLQLGEEEILPVLSQQQVARAAQGLQSHTALDGMKVAPTPLSCRHLPLQSYTSALRPNLELPVFIYNGYSSLLMKCFIWEHS